MPNTPPVVAEMEWYMTHEEVAEDVLKGEWITTKTVAESGVAYARWHTFETMANAENA